MRNQAPPEWLSHVFPFAFPLMWVLVTVVLAFQSGWVELARAYPAPRESEGERFRWRSGRLGAVSYSGVLNFVVNRDGLRVSVLLLFGLACRPFFVPWADVEAVRGKRFFSRIVQLRFRRVPIASLELSSDLAKKLADAAGGAMRLPIQTD